MNNLLAGGFFESYGILIILVVCLVVVFVMNYMRNKQYQENEQKTMDSLKVGAEVKTTCGIYGKIHAINETKDGKVITLETDSGSLIAFDARAIYNVVDRTIIEEDDLDDNLDDDLEEPKTKTTEEVKTEAEEKVEENKEEK